MDRCSRTAMLALLLAATSAQPASAAFVGRSVHAEIAAHVAVNHSAVAVHKQVTAAHVAVNHSAVAVQKQVSSGKQEKTLHQHTAAIKPVFLAHSTKALSYDRGLSKLIDSMLKSEEKLEPPSNRTMATTNATVDSGVDSSGTEEVNATKVVATDTSSEEDNATQAVVNGSSAEGGNITQAVHGNSSDTNTTHVTVDKNATTLATNGTAGRNSTEAASEAASDDEEESKEVIEETRSEETKKVMIKQQPQEVKEEEHLSKDEMCALKMQDLAVKLGRHYTNAHLESTLVSYCVTSAEFPAAKHLEDGFESKSRCEKMAKQLTAVRMAELSSDEENQDRRGYVNFCKSYYGEVAPPKVTHTPTPVPKAKKAAAHAQTISQVCVAALLLVSASLGPF